MTRRRAIPLLPTWMYSCRSGGTVSCALRFTTNVTISTFISQTFRSRVAIFHLRQPMKFLSHSPYGMPGFAPLMNVLFEERHDFHLSSSDRNMAGNVWNRPSGSFMDLIKYYEVSLSKMLQEIMGHDPIQWHPQMIGFTPICELITELDSITHFDLITIFREVSIKYCNGCG